MQSVNLPAQEKMLTCFVFSCVFSHLKTTGSKNAEQITCTQLPSFFYSNIFKFRMKWDSSLMSLTHSSTQVQMSHSGTRGFIMWCANEAVTAELYYSQFRHVSCAPEGQQIICQGSYFQPVGRGTGSPVSFTISNRQFYI